VSIQETKFFRGQAGITGTTALPAVSSEECVSWGVSIRDNGRNAFSGPDDPHPRISRIFNRLKLGRKNEAEGLPKQSDQRR
jgi:hypothetical protein